MNTIVISYSLTGNNDNLARSLAEALGARHVRVMEEKERTIWRIALDMMFNRTPGVIYDLEEIQPCDLVVFVAPIWMGGAASPLRDCFRKLQKSIAAYAFVSISGGADDNSNPKLTVDLRKRLRKEPAAVIALYTADLLPPEPKPGREDTSAYKTTSDDTKRLTEEAISILQKEGLV